MLQLRFPHSLQTMDFTLVSAFPFLEIRSILRQRHVPALYTMSIMTSPLSSVSVATNIKIKLTDVAWPRRHLQSGTWFGCYVATSPPHVLAQNLDYKKLDPFCIIEKINEVPFRLALPPTFRIHNVFHISLLEKYHPSRIPGRQPPPSPPVELSIGEEYEVDQILDSRYHRRQLQYLFLWKGYPLSEPNGNQTLNPATWEPTTHLQNAREAIRAFHQRYSQKPARGLRRRP